MSFGLGQDDLSDASILDALTPTVGPTLGTGSPSATAVQGNITEWQVATASPQLAMSYVAQNPGTIILWGFAIVGGLMLMGALSKR